MVMAPAERRSVAVLLVLLAVLYLPALQGQVLDWDDRIWLEDPALSSPWLAVTTSRDRVYAPLLRLTFALQHAVFGTWIPAFHAVDLVAWLAIVAGVWWLLRRFGLPARSTVIATALWAFHPTKVECVAWLTGWKDLLSGLLLVGAAVVSTTQAPAALVTALAAGAVLAKPAVFPLVFVLAVALATLSGPTCAIRRTGPACAAALLVALAGLVTWAPRPLGESTTERLTRMGWVHGVFWEKLFPTSLPAAITPLTPDALPVILVGLSLTTAFALLAWRDQRFRLPLLLWLLPQLPFVGLVDMAFWASDRHLLFPSLGVAVALAMLLERAGWLPLVLAAALAVPTALRIPEWQSSEALWNAEVTRPGDHPDRWFKLAMVDARAGRFADSVEDWNRVLVLRPQDRVAFARRLIASLAAEGTWTDEDRAATRLLEPAPETADQWAKAADALKQAGRPDLADQARNGPAMPVMGRE